MQKNYIVFTLGEKDYALSLSDVQEIVRIVAITPIPDSPPFVSGVINLRGKVVPVLNLKKRFYLEGNYDPLKSHLLVTNLHGNLVALMVDDVREVEEFSKDSLEEPQKILPMAKYLKSVGRKSHRLVLILDLPKLLDFKILEELMERKAERDSDEHI